MDMRLAETVAAMREVLEELDAELDRQLYDDQFVRQCRNNDLDIPTDAEHCVTIRQALREKIAAAANRS